jgi:hypothetical protein
MSRRIRLLTCLLLLLLLIFLLPLLIRHTVVIV